MKKVQMLVALIAVVLAPSVVLAVPITVKNAGFDNPTIATQGQSSWVGGGIAGWTSSYGVGMEYNVGVFNPDTVQYATVPGNVGFVRGNSSIEQVLDYTVAAGDDLTLTVAVGWRSDNTGYGTYSIELWGGTSLLDSANNTTDALTKGTFKTVTLSHLVSSGDSAVNQTLKIVVKHTGTNTQVNLDNFQVDNGQTAAVPEPATLLLLGGGFLGLGLFRRVRRHS
jgi:hypothetical protein